MNNYNISTDVEGVQQYFTLNMLQDTLKSSLGDGMEFELVYQGLLDTINNSDTTGLTEKKTINTREGQVLQDIPISRLYGFDYSNVYPLKDINVGSSVTESTGEIYDAVNKYSEIYGVDPKLILSVIKAESNFDSKATSHAGAMGVMQLMPSVCSDYGVSNPYNIDENIRAGVNLLRDHLDRYNGDLPLTLMAYNAGAGTVSSRGVTSIDDLYKMPRETQNYVSKIINFYKNGTF